MQRSWRQDPDKLTFITCRPIPQSRAHESAQLVPEDEGPSNMVGDINLFLRVDDGDEGDEQPRLVGEIELMVAEKANQRQGFGRASLLVFLRYVVQKQGQILDEFVSGSVSLEQKSKLRKEGDGFVFECLSVKIGKENERSLALFESVGFVKVSAEPSFFGEYELRRTDLGDEGVRRSLVDAGVEGYTQLCYERKE